MKFIFFSFIFTFLSLQDAWGQSEKKSVLLSSPVCQTPQILKEFLLGINELENEGYSLSILFLDDNFYVESSELLKQFQAESTIPCQIIKAQRDYLTPFYLCDENTHHWTPDLIWRLAGLKNQILDEARNGKYDYLLLIDSDLLIHPQTIQRLVKANVPIVSNLYWTQETKNSSYKPQVWLSDYDTRYQRGDREQVSPEDILKRQESFYNMLKKPGVYEVGGVAGCILIRKDALNQKINFTRLKNLTYPDDDCYFSIRACALGIKLYVDTHRPALHLYRQSDLTKINDYKNGNDFNEST